MEEFDKYEVVETCDLCGSTNIKEYYKPSDLVMCTDCHFLFVSPRPGLVDIYNAYSDKNFYDGWIKESEGRLRMWQKRYSRIKEFITSPSNILDYGAGIGTFMHLAKLDGHNIDGTELSETAKRIANEQYGLALFDIDYFFTQRYFNYYDVVTAWHVVEHVISPRILIDNFHKILRPGGWLFIAVPNAKAKPLKKLFSKQNMEITFPKLKKGNEIHLSQFTAGTLERLLESTGFNIIRERIDDFYPVPDYKTNMRYYLYLSIKIISNINYSPTIFVVAQKR